MKYRILCDGIVLYDSDLDQRDEKIKILSGTLSLKKNKAGTAVFTIARTNQCYSSIRKLWSIITVEKDGKQVFRGRALNDPVNIYGDKKITCEGDLAFLNDSVIGPTTFTGAPADLLYSILLQHNAQVEDRKKIFPGVVTAGGTVTIERTSYSTTMGIISDYVLAQTNGFLYTRESNGSIFLDYLASVDDLNNQGVYAGWNMIDLTITEDGEKIATAIMPISRQTDGTFVDISSVNGGVKYLTNPVMVSNFGTIMRTVQYEGITDPNELKAKGMQELSNLSKIPETISLTAADLKVAGVDVESISILKKLQVGSDFHNFKKDMVISEMTVNLEQPWKVSIVLGDVSGSISSASVDLQKTQVSTVENTYASIEKLKESLKGMGGLYETTEQAAEGGDIIYFHNKPELSESNLIWRFSTEALAISTDGGVTYPYGYAANGNLFTHQILVNEGVELYGGNESQRPYIDFHFGENAKEPSGKDYSLRIIEYEQSKAYFWKADQTTAEIVASNVSGSDRNLKDNIRYIDPDEAYQFINRLYPAAFEYINDGDRKRHHGLIYQDVVGEVTENNSAFLTDVMYKDEKYGALVYQELIADMIGAIKKLSNEVETLKSQIGDNHDI